MASPRSSISISRKIARGTGALVLGAAIALMSIEVGMRAIGYGAVMPLAYGRNNYHPDLPDIGYAGRSNIRGVQTREGVADVQFNSHGFNDTEHDRVPAADAYRIVVVGNSYSMNFQVEREDGYVSRLGEELRKCPVLANRKVETINLGVDGYTIHQQFLMLRDYGLSLSPDFVLLQVNSFVPAGDLNPSLILAPRLDLSDAGDLVIDRSYQNEPGFKRRASSIAALVQRLSDYSRLLQYVLEYHRVSASPATREDRASARAAVAPQVFDAYRRGRALVFDQLAKLLGARKIPWGVTIVPTADATSYAQPVRDEWENLAARNGVPFFDVEEEARAEVRATRRDLHGFGMAGGHLNRFGNAFFAKALGSRICEFLTTRSAVASG
jgi:hypothetical protein